MPPRATRLPAHVETPAPGFEALLARFRGLYEAGRAHRALGADGACFTPETSRAEAAAWWLGARPFPRFLLRSQ